MPRGLSIYDEAQLQGRLWSPSTVAPNLVGWWDADDLSTITVSTGVSEWRDKSGYGRNFSQATSGNQPTLNLNNVNGRNSIKFTRTSSTRLDATNLPTTISQVALFLVTRWLTTGTTTSTLQTPIDNAYSTNTGWVLQDRPDLTNKPLSALHLNYPGGNGAVDTANTGDDTWKIICVTFVGGTGGADTLYVNGLQKASYTNTFSFVNNATLRVGGEVGNSTRFFNGSHAEILLISDVSAIVRQTIEGYLAWKWGLASSLVATHPFYNRPPLIGAI